MGTVRLQTGLLVDRPFCDRWRGVHEGGSEETLLLYHTIIGEHE